MPNIFNFLTRLLLLCLDVSVLPSTSNRDSDTELCFNDLNIITETQASIVQVKRASAVNDGKFK